MTEATTYGTLIVAASTLVLAIAYVIRRCNGFQLGTCCKLTVGASPSPRNGVGDIEMPVPISTRPMAGEGHIADAIIPVVSEIVRRLSRDNTPNPRHDGGGAAG